MQIGIVSLPYFLRASIVFNYACAISSIRFITLLVLHSDVLIVIIEHVIVTKCDRANDSFILRYY